MFKFNSNNSLSSILDLVDASDLSQKSLFSNETWKELVSLFKSELLLEFLPVPNDLVNSWNIIAASIKTTMNISFGMTYIYKILPKQSTEVKRYMKIYEHVLEAVNTYPHMDSKSPAKDCDFSESDVLRIIWSPLLEL